MRVAVHYLTLVLLAAFILRPTASRAQGETTSAIAGQVVDESGAALVRGSSLCAGISALAKWGRHGITRPHPNREFRLEYSNSKTRHYSHRSSAADQYRKPKHGYLIECAGIGKPAESRR